MANIYQQAAKQKLRFPSSRGALTVEQLMDLPMTSKISGKLNLKSIAEPIAAKVAKGSSSLLSFFDNTPSDPEASLQLAIISDIVATKQAEAYKKSQEKVRETEKAKIESLIAQKQTEAMSGLSIEDLQKKLASL